ncbi:MAG: hypothetical protein ACKV2V_00385 [Blastocatellia bacterium]
MKKISEGYIERGREFVDAGREAVVRGRGFADKGSVLVGRGRGFADARNVLVGRGREFAGAGILFVVPAREVIGAGGGYVDMGNGSAGGRGEVFARFVKPACTLAACARNRRRGGDGVNCLRFNTFQNQDWRIGAIDSVTLVQYV